MTSAKAWAISGWCGLIFIVALVIAVATPRVFDLHENQRLNRAFLDLDKLRHGLDAYKVRHGKFPSKNSGLPVLMEEGLIDELRRDPWDSFYAYQPIDGDRAYLLYSVGMNGIDEGGNGDDITGASKNYCTPYGLDCPAETAVKLALLAVLVARVGSLVGLLAFGLIAVYRRFVPA